MQQPIASMFRLTKAGIIHPPVYTVSHSRIPSTAFTLEIQATFATTTLVPIHVIVSCIPNFGSRTQESELHIPDTSMAFYNEDGGTTDLRNIGAINEN
jgi:hypothetical protein